MVLISACLTFYTSEFFLQVFVGLGASLPGLVVRDYARSSHLVAIPEDVGSQIFPFGTTIWQLR